MSKADKLIARLKSKPKDFKWAEAVSLMTKLGYTQLEGDGSRVKFVAQNTKRVICLHKPHPSSEMKQYAVIQLLEALINYGSIK